jgi:hypothetical protein
MTSKDDLKHEIEQSDDSYLNCGVVHLTFPLALSANTQPLEVGKLITLQMSD